MDRLILLIRSIGTDPSDPFWNLESAPITHYPNFYGSDQLPNGSTQPISIHTVLVQVASLRGASSRGARSSNRAMI